MSRFTLPRDLYYGRGSLEVLKTLEGKRATIVLGGGSMRRYGFLHRVMGFLKEAGVETELFENVEPDPSVETVLRGAQAMEQFGPDWIVAIGGGSPLDAAKAMWAFYEYPELKFQDLITPFGFPKLRKKARMLCIPSTSGTASEVTAFSVITDYRTGVKYPLADYEITPDVAILDPDLADTMPQSLTAHTGMDALTHAFEAFVSKLHSPFTDPLALQAIEMVFKHLPASYEGEKEAREQMHYAQCMAGMAFTNALLGIVHSMAHKTGAAFEDGHIPHGCANAMYLPYVMGYNAKDAEAAARYAQIARRVGLVGDTDLSLMDKLREKVLEYNRKFGIPRCLKEFGVPEEEFLEKLPGIAQRAVADACTGSNPRPITVPEMEELLKCCYYGKE